MSMEGSPPLRIPSLRYLPRSKQCCGNCNAFQQGTDKRANPRQGWCRAGPPGLVQGMSQNPLQPGQIVPTFQGMWPPVQNNGWCRAWELEERIYDDAERAS
jgi:hypothetical protein